MRLNTGALVLAALLLLGPVAGQTSSINGRNLGNGTVGLPKLATQANNTALCNVSGSTASPTACTSTQLKTLLGLGIADVLGLQAALDGKQANLQFQGGGTNQGAAGGIATVNFTGAGVTASAASGTLTVNVPGGGGGGILSSAKASLPTCNSSAKGTTYYTTDVRAGLGTLAACDGANWQFLDGGVVYPDGYSSLQAAVTATQSSQLRLVVGPGTYSLSSPLLIGDNADLVFERGAKLQPSTASNTVVQIQANYYRIDGLTVDVSNQTTYTGIAVDVLGTNNMYDRFGCTLSNLYISGNFTQTGTGLRLFSGGAGATARHISQCVFANVAARGFDTGVLLTTVGGISGDYVNGNIFPNLRATYNKYNLKLAGVAGAEVAKNQFTNFNFQYGTGAVSSVQISGQASGNYFLGITWDWGATTPVYDIQGTGSSYNEPVGNRITDLGQGESNLRLADNNYYESLSPTKTSGLTNRPIAPGGDNSRNFTGDQDDILAGATYRYSVTQPVGPAPVSTRSGSLADLFGPHGKVGWSLTTGQSVTVRIDLNPDGLGYDYVFLIGLNFFDSGSVADTVTVSTGDTAPALTTATALTGNNRSQIFALNGGLNGTWQVRYIDVTLTNNSGATKTISLQRIFAQGLIRKGPFWPQGSNGQLLVNQGGQLLGAIPSGLPGQQLISQGSGNVPTWYSPADENRLFPLASWDFTTTGTAAGPFAGAAISTGTNTTAPASGVVTKNHPGVILLRSSATANSGYSYLTTATFLLGGGEQFDAVVWMPAALTNNTLRAGYLDTTTSADAVDGVYVEIPATGAAVCKTSNNSTRTTSPTVATLAASTWYHVRVSVASTASATCAIYGDTGTLLGSQTVTSNIPTAAGRETGAGIVGTNSGTTASDLYAVDMMSFGYSAKLTRGQ